PHPPSPIPHPPSPIPHPPSLLKITVLGAGAIGAYYGGQLARAGHDVTLYARGDNLAAIRERGLEIRTPDGSSVVQLAATDRVQELGNADFAILGVKSYSLDSIATVVQSVARNGAAILPFLNGVETTERLIALGVPRGSILGGVTRISVARVQPGVVERRGAFQSVIVGELDNRITERVKSIVTAFRDAGVDANTSNQIELDLWQKFVFIAAIAASCGLARTPIGPLRDRPLGRRLLQRAVQEVVDVARARGIPLAADETARVIGAIDALPPGTKPSFLLDIEAGGLTELDTLSGAVSRYAAAAGIQTPIHDTVAAVLGSGA
ncbi:MAG: ketopantoate reductase family protein, partial [Gemmatimonadaceae bacterium]